MFSQSSSVPPLRLLAIAVLCVAGGVTATWSAGVARHATTFDNSRVVQDILPATPRVPAGVGARAAPASGTTGTIALPAFAPTGTAPTDTVTIGADNGAARFSLRGIGSIDRARALQCLTAAIYYEAATEGDAGQAAVAQVVLNRVRHPAFPASVCGVVYQGAAHRGCQFSFACDGAAARVPNAAGWARAARVAARALTGRVFAPVGLATHYHTYAVTPAWNRSLVMTDAVGAHFFHRWKGFWGTAAAFTQRYRGGEPGIAAATPSDTLPIAAVRIAAAAPVGQAPLPAPAKTTAQTTSPTASTDRLPPAATVLDRWKLSGTPLDRPAQR